MKYFITIFFIFLITPIVIAQERKKESNYFLDKDQRLFNRIKDSFKSPPSIIKKESCKTNSIKPIFIHRIVFDSDE